MGNAIKLNSAEHTNPWLRVHKPHIEQCHHLLTEAHSAGFKFKLHCSSVLLINIQSTHLSFSTEKGLKMALQELKNSYLIEMKTQGFGPDNWMKLCCTSSFSGLTSFYDNDNWKMAEEKKLYYRAGLTKCPHWVLNSLLLHLYYSSVEHQASGYSVLTRLPPL